MNEAKNAKKLEEASTGCTYGTMSDLQIESNQDCEEEKKKTKYTPKQKLSFLVLAVGELCAGFLASLQAPFFPEEAEKKGATATEYGLVIGIYNLTIVLTAPLIGKLVGHISPKFILNVGFFMLGTTSILFGILDFVMGSMEFIGLALVIRISEGIGAACVRIASGTIVASQFKNDVGSAYSLLEMCLGVGIILGPALGSALYELGGFKVPFVSIGCLVLVDAVFVMIVLPEAERSEKKPTKFINIFKAWVKPQILVFTLSVFSSFSFLGFLAVGLEPHLRQTKLSKIYVALIFSIVGIVYALSSPFWGWLHDKLCKSTVMNVVGCGFFIVAVLFLGPVPFIPLEPDVYLIGIAMIATGFSTGAKTVSSFTGALHSAKVYGFPDDLGTYGIITSIITCSKSLGSALGPLLGGAFIDHWGFRFASLPYLFYELALIATLIVMIMAEQGTSKVFRTAGRNEANIDSVISLDLKPLSSLKLKNQEAISRKLSCEETFSAKIQGQEPTIKKEQVK